MGQGKLKRPPHEVSNHSNQTLKINRQSLTSQLSRLVEYLDLLNSQLSLLWVTTSSKPSNNKKHTVIDLACTSNLKDIQQAT